MSGGHVCFYMFLTFRASNNLEVILLCATYSSEARQEEHVHLRYDTIWWIF